MSKIKTITQTIAVLIITMACLTSTVIPSAPPAASTPLATERGSAPERLNIPGQENEAGEVFEITEVQTTCAIVTADVLHIRIGPSEAEAVAGYLTKGETVKVEKMGRWWKITTLQGATGWSNSKYLRECGE